MKEVKLLFFAALCINYISCSSQNVVTKNKNTLKGVLVYYMNEPYFFPIVDTTIEKISKSNTIGIKLGKIDMNDIFWDISYKRDVVIYAARDNNKVDTFKSKVGVMLVKMETRPTQTKLSSDSSAFSLVTANEEWVFRYEIRFDMEVLSIKPALASDKKVLEQRMKELQSQN